jgi:2-keto-4-pentenoate hydratase
MAPAELAALLEREHRERVPFHSLLREAQLPVEVASLDHAYAVQDAFVARLGAAAGKPRGYKVGLTSRRMQQMCGIEEPVAGRVLARRVHASPAEVLLDRHLHLGIESELCLLLKADLPARATPYSSEEVARAVGSAAAAFELIDDRGADYAHLDAFTLVADNSWNAGVVLAAGSDAGGLDLSALEGRLLVDDRLVDRGHVADALGSPSAVLAWLAAHVGRRGEALRAGDFVMTGSVVPTRFARAGEHYRFELTGLAAVELRIRSGSKNRRTSGSKYASGRVG